MPERATLYQVVQVGVEATPGTAVAATKRLRGVTIEPAIQQDIQVIRGTGAVYPLMTALTREWVEADIGGTAAYNDLPYLFASVLADVTPVQVTPPSGTAYRWTYTPSQDQPDALKTLTVEFGSSVRAARFAHGLVPEISLSFARDEVGLSGTLTGRRLEDGFTLSTGAVDVPLVPILPGTVDVYLDATAASIGTTRLTRVLSAEFTVSDRYDYVWTLDSAQPSFTTFINTAPTAQVTLLVEADAQGMALLDDLRQGVKRFGRIRARGPQIESGASYQLTIDFCGMVADVGDFSDEDGVYAIEWTLALVYDANWDKAFTVELINTLPAL